jgi:hypothetical protein
MSEKDSTDESLMRFIMRNGLPIGSATRARFIDDMIHLLNDGFLEERIRTVYQKFLKPPTVNEYLRIAQEIRVSSARHRKSKKKEAPKNEEKAEPTD